MRKFNLSFYYNPFYFYFCQFFVVIVLLLQTNGEAKFTLSGLSTLNRYLNERYLLVEANVTESLTKITLNGTGKIQFHQHAEKMEFLDSNPNTFKPGLPCTAYVSINGYFKCLFLCKGMLICWIEIVLLH